MQLRKSAGRWLYEFVALTVDRTKYNIVALARVTTSPHSP